MPTPRKPERPSAISPKLIGLACLTAVLLIGGWLWMHYTPAKPVFINHDRQAATVNVSHDSAAASPVATPVPLATPPAPASTATKLTRRNAVRPAATRADEEVRAQDSAAERAAQPAPPPCDQLVMRNGDLIDAKILEIGVHEIRYRKCRRQDGPDYVIPRQDVLSIRHANGDIERLSGRVVPAAQTGAT